MLCAEQRLYSFSWKLLLSLRRSIFDATLMKNDPPAGAVAQLGERSVRNAEVEGSIPFRSINLNPAESWI